jgi:hypothetical protein
MSKHSSLAAVFFVACVIGLGAVSRATLGLDDDGQSPDQGPKQQDPSRKKPGIYTVKKNQPLQPPPALPQSAIPQQQPGTVPTRQAGSTPPNQTIGDAAPPSNLAAQVVTGKLGVERVQQFLNGVQDRPGKGSSTASTYFDGANIRTGNDDVVPSRQSPLFQGTGPQTSVPVPRTVHEYNITTAQDSKNIGTYYGSIPGGVVLEGSAVGLGPINRLTYDSRFNAITLDDRAVYFMKVRPQTVAMLCKAIARSDKVGVSLGTVQIAYGVPRKSRLAGDLMLADSFLGDIAFARREWTAGYKFANEYEPQRFNGSVSVAVFFRFSGFQFEIQQQELRVVQESFDDRIILLSNARAADGGHLPDEAGISGWNVPREWEANLKHIADNISYYRRERIIDQVFSYGEVAAFIRGLKQEGVDLLELADAIEEEFPDDGGEN